VLWISDNSSVLVEERSSGLLKGNAVLLLVNAVLPRIPFEADVGDTDSVTTT
jgi:hypothetical protein